MPTLNTDKQLKFYNYERWLFIVGITDEERWENCEVCDGEGYHECECGDSHRCKACNGKGKIDVAIKEYFKLRAEQEIKWKIWHSF